MSFIWSLNAEVRSGEGWTIPAELPPKDNKYGCDIGGEFGWMKGRSVHCRDELFFGAGALIPFACGRPPGSSEFCRLWDAYQPGWDSDMEVYWIAYERLYVELWDDPSVLVKSGIRSRFLSHFGDGAQTLPEAELLAAGATGEDVNELWLDASLASDVVDHLNDWQRSNPGRLEISQPDANVTVTWRASINWLLPSSADFQQLRHFGNAADLRVIVLGR